MKPELEFDPLGAVSVVIPTHQRRELTLRALASVAAQSVRPREVLGGRWDGTDLLVLAGVAVAASAYGLWRFPRRDLAAPS